MIDPTALRDIIRSGLLSFPVTPFDAEDRFNPNAFSAHLEWLSPHKIAGLIVAGGTGELFSLTPAEVVEVVKTARAARPAGDRRLRLWHPHGLRNGAGHRGGGW